METLGFLRGSEVTVA